MKSLEHIYIIHTNVECNVTHIKLFPWLPPPLRHLKFNMDRETNNSVVSIAIVIRANSRSVSAETSSYISRGNNNKAKVDAIMLAVEKYVKWHAFGDIIESYLSFILNMLNGIHTTTWNYHSVYLECSLIIKKLLLHSLTFPCK